MKTNETLDLILYGKGTYVSALPVLMWSTVFYALYNLVERLVRKCTSHN